MALISETPLISTLVMGISAAFVGGMITAKLRLSPIVGYLLAGILIGPYTPGYVGDSMVASQLADIGIVLLMFGVGLHFSIKDLMEVKRIALPGAVAQILVATGLGYALAQRWGWPFESSMLFGLSLSVASTVVLLRALEERNALYSINGHIAVGWLIVEDIFIVLALVLIPALAPELAEGDEAHQGIWVSFGIALLKIGLFLCFILLAGKRVLPWLLDAVAHTRSRELFTLSVFVVAVGVAFGSAYMFDISFALGAFFAGMMIKGSKLSDQVIEKALPFQDAFAVLFFVSVGMLFNPSIVLQEPVKVIAVVLIIMVGKSIAAFAIVLLFNYPAHTALKISASLAQIGEFSFVLSTLGLANGLLSEEANSLILAGALISISLNPLAFRATDGLFALASRYPQLTRWLSVEDDALTHLSGDERQVLKDIVILVGYGRVGRYLQQNLRSAHIDLVIIDLNRERVESMRAQGIHAIYGDAHFKETLEEAAIQNASAIVVAVPNPHEVRRIVETARSLKPGLKVLVRAEDEKERAYYQEQNMDLAVVGTQEIARRMMDYLRELRQ